MRVTSINMGKNGLYDIFADGEYLCSLEDVDIARLNIGISDQVEADELIRLSRLSAAKRDGLRMVLSRRYASGEAGRKLLQKGHDEESAQYAVDYLIQKGYINNSDYAARYAHDAVYLRKEGTFRIKAALREKGVSEQDIASAVGNTVDMQRQNLRQLIEKAMQGDTSPKAVLKLKSRLFARGYDTDGIDSAIQTYIGGHVE